MRKGFIVYSAYFPQFSSEPVRRKSIVRCLAKLEGNESIVHSHNGYKTSLASWLATLRGRLKKNFGYETLGGGLYRIFLKG